MIPHVTRFESCDKIIKKFRKRFGISHPWYNIMCVVCMDTCIILVSSTAMKDHIPHFSWGDQNEENKNDLIQEFRIDISLCSPSYTNNDTYERGKLRQSYDWFVFFGVSTKDEKLDLPSLCWMSLFPTKILFSKLTYMYCILTRFLSYCDTSYSMVVWIRCGVCKFLKIC